YGPYIDEALIIYNAGGAGILPATYFPQHDRQYSIRSLVDSSATTVESYDYSPFGKRTAFNVNGQELNTQSQTAISDFGYTGRRLDSETGLWYFRARYYSDDLGRFISRDPIGYVDGMSLYSGYFAGGLGMDPAGTVKLPNLRKNGKCNVSVNLICRTIKGMVYSPGLHCYLEVVDNTSGKRIFTISATAENPANKYFPGKILYRPSYDLKLGGGKYPFKIVGDVCKWLESAHKHAGKIHRSFDYSVSCNNSNRFITEVIKKSKSAGANFPYWAWGSEDVDNVNDTCYKACMDKANNSPYAHGRCRSKCLLDLTR
ncbi:MAG: RHS repeat-associated core domain-containing protein, partial [Lentisphaeraceae bacterium]|nr:RHS repeat-associated core domain-containing protein [Lentisphaeraceae bacterium]